MPKYAFIDWRKAGTTNGISRIEEFETVEEATEWGRTQGLEMVAVVARDDIPGFPLLCVNLSEQLFRN